MNALDCIGRVSVYVWLVPKNNDFWDTVQDESRVFEGCSNYVEVCKEGRLAEVIEQPIGKCQVPKQRMNLDGLGPEPWVVDGGQSEATRNLSKRATRQWT